MRETTLVAEPPLLDATELTPASVQAAVDGRLGVAGPVRFGADPATDGSVLRFLAAATAGFVDVGWELAGEPPYTPRDLVHLCPPRRFADAAAERFGQHWRANHRFGLCSYRQGPGFRTVRDVRPDGGHLRAVVDEPWADAFDSLVADPVTPAAAAPLLDELVHAGLALRLGAQHHVVLPYRLIRRPIPYNAI